MKKRYYLSLMTLMIGCTLCLGDLSDLFAQEEEEQYEFTLEEITVTAQKREENQQKVPIAMDIITSEEIKELGKNDLSEMLSSASNAIVQKASDGYRISMRGMTDMSSPQQGQQTAAPTVAINMDGVYSNRKDTASNLYDVERVEVLYGPQSTMYSSNSPGGVVNVVTAQPKLDEFGASGSVEVGNYSLLHTEGSVNVPVGDKTAIRTSFSTSKRDGYLSNGSDDSNTKSGRFRVLFQANDKLSFTGTAEVTNDKSSGFGGGVETFADQDDTTDPWTGTDSDSRSDSDVTSRKFSGQMSWETSLGSLSFVPSYSTRNGTSVMVVSQSNSDMSQSTREKDFEVRMTSPSDFMFRWIAGATYYYSKDGQIYYSDDYQELGEGEWSNKVIEEKNKAIYANITYPIMDRFRLTAGYRRSWDTMITDNNEVRGIQGETVPVYYISDTLAYYEEYYEQSNDGMPDYKFGFEYDLGENSMLYGDYSTSYRVQAMGNASQESPPEKLKAYSIGSKNRFFGNKVQLNTSAYYYDYKDFSAGFMGNQVWLYDLDGNLEADYSMDGGEVFQDPNAGSRLGEGFMYGFDLQTSVIITEKDMLNLSVSYEKSEWTDLGGHWYYPYTLEVVNGELVQVDNDAEDYEGKTMFNTPPWTINLSYSHNFTLPNGGVIKAGVSSKFKSSYRLSWKESDYPNNYQEDYHMENVNAVYSNPNGKWSLTGYVNNVFNYAEKVNYMGAGGGGQLSIGNPRTYGGILSLKF